MNVARAAKNKVLIRISIETGISIQGASAQQPDNTRGGNPRESANGFS